MINIRCLTNTLLITLTKNDTLEIYKGTIQVYIIVIAIFVQSYM